MKFRSVLLFLLAACPLLAQDHWVASWTTAQPLIRQQPPAPPPATAAPAAAPTPSQGLQQRGFTNQTVRMFVRTSVGGTKLRIKLSNPFGGMPVEVGSAHVALHAKDTEIVPASDHALAFNGKASTVIGPGMVILSDAIDMAVPKQGELAVSLYFPGATGAPAGHNGLRTSYVSKEGDATGAVTIPDATPAPAYYYLESVDVLAPANAALIVTFGDSITEGARSTPDTGNTWPNLLAARLAANKNTTNLAVGNMGIGGNRVMRDGSGASALARFDRDVLSQSGVKWVTLLEGINDIGRSNVEPVTADDLIGAYKQLIERAHAHGVKVVGCTLTPYEGAGYARPEGEAIRQAFNTWIRTSSALDAVIDFEAAVRDPASPGRIRAEFDPGDHLHPNDAGYKAMAESIDLAIFTGKRGK